MVTTRNVPEVKLEAHVVEWSMEDPDRYERITGHSLRPQNLTGPLFRSRAEREAYEAEQLADRPQVVVVVLEVPRAEMQAVTQRLREAPKLRPAKYAPRLGPAADMLTQVDEDLIAMTTRAEAMEDLARKLAGSFDLRVELARGNGTIKEWTETQIQLAPKARHDVVKRNLDQLRAAVSERSVSVAAQMLAQVDDDL